VQLYCRCFTVLHLVVTVFHCICWPTCPSHTTQFLNPMTSDILCDDKCCFLLSMKICSSVWKQLVHRVDVCPLNFCMRLVSIEKTVACTHCRKCHLSIYQCQQGIITSRETALRPLYSLTIICILGVYCFCLQCENINIY
jgi:hypothetical protein